MQLPNFFQSFLDRVKQAKKNSRKLDSKEDTKIQEEELSSFTPKEDLSNKVKTTTVNDLQDKRKAVLRNYGLGIILLAFLVVGIMAAISLFAGFSEKATERAKIEKKENVDLSFYGNEDTWKIQVNNRIIGINNKLDNKFHEIRESTKQDAKDARKLIDTSISLMTDQIDKGIKKLNWLVEDVKDDFKKITDDTKKELLETRDDIAEARKSINSTEERLKQYTNTQLQQSLVDLEQRLLGQISSNTNLLNKPRVTINGGLTNIPGGAIAEGAIGLAAPTYQNGGGLSLFEKSIFGKDSEKKVEEMKEQEVVLDYDKEDVYRFTNITDIDVDDSVDYDAVYSLKDEEKKEQEPGLHIMTGFSKALLITGVAAPTFGQGLQNPKPVILTVESDLIIANDDTEDLKNCMLLGTATGNMNSSRAEIQITRLSCSITQRDGKKYKIEQSGSPLGWVIGEDGKYGLKGRLVDSSSKVIMRELMVGFLQGVSEAFANQGDKNDGTTDISLGASSGAGTGAGQAFDNLAEYYKKMLDGLYPVIDVKAGRKVTILFKGSTPTQETRYRSVEVQERRDSGAYNSNNAEEIEIGYQNW
ncbi:MAG: F-type type IV conjugative transfer system protein TraB [uncultured Campylobacterales bacterium]|uniref:F-type type IV conjugative transfer system protein TraB n=1 Tax=uncultured Campylobacterales bacterium TaxID=352960 RepID=A0A6S6TIF4_9BACT|nr:MAG: F-type type IV conjugative transfer system protein TraB [uncultured Campylobacterales bacterium]